MNERTVGMNPTLAAPYGERAQKTFRRPYAKRAEVIAENTSLPDMGCVREKRIENLDKGLRKGMKDDNYHSIRYFKKEIEIQKMYQAAERTYDRGDTTMTFEGNIRRFLNPTGY